VDSVPSVLTSSRYRSVVITVVGSAATSGTVTGASESSITSVTTNAGAVRNGDVMPELPVTPSEGNNQERNQ
jgi:hypothetical protein